MEVPVDDPTTLFEILDPQVGSQRSFVHNASFAFALLKLASVCVTLDCRAEA